MSTSYTFLCFTIEISIFLAITTKIIWSAVNTCITWGHCINSIGANAGSFS